MLLIRILLALTLLMAAGAAASEKTVVVLGDSIAAGYGLEMSKAYPALLQEKIRDAKLPWKVVNAGVSGDTTAGGVRRLTWLLKRDIDLLVIELGGNDGLRGIPPSETKANLSKMIDIAREKNPKMEIVIAGMQMPANMGKEYTTRFKETFSEVASEKKVHLVPFLLEGVGGIPHLNLADRIHPNEAGQKIVANNIWAVLEPLLRGNGTQAKKQ